MKKLLLILILLVTQSLISCSMKDLQSFNDAMWGTMASPPPRSTSTYPHESNYRPYTPTPAISNTPNQNISTNVENRSIEWLREQRIRREADREDFYNRLGNTYNNTGDDLDCPCTFLFCGKTPMCGYAVSSNGACLTEVACPYAY